LSELIATRDLNFQMKGEGVLGDLGYITAKEAILELTGRLETAAKTIEQLQEAD